MFCRIVDGVIDIGVDAAHQGQQLQAYLVAGVIGLKIGAVCYICLACGVEPLFNLIAGYAEQGTDYAAVFWLDAGKALDSCASDKIEQDGLDGIIAVVCYAYGACLALAHGVFKIGVA